MDIAKRLFSGVPLASTVFLAYAIVGAISLIAGSLVYGTYSDNLLAIGIACGAIGLPRAVAKAQAGLHHATGVLGLIEDLPIPSLVFVLFLTASSVSLAIGSIEYGQFSDNVLKVGIACGAIAVPRIVHKRLPKSAAPPSGEGIGV